MSKHIAKFFWIFICSICCLPTYAQQRTCGAWHPTNQPHISQEYQRLHLKKRKKYEQLTTLPNRQATACTSPIQLPIAVHFQGINAPDTTCLRALAEDQIMIINRDLNAQNADTTLWLADASSFPSVSLGQACIEFILANKNHPAGYGLKEGDLAVTINTTDGDMLPSWSGYVNIIVRDIADLGYAPLGGLGNGDAVNVDINAFGTFGCGQVIPQAPYHEGRTVVHELGHYLYLNHIWANGFDEPGCGFDDGIADTPVSDQPHFGCPSLSSSCSSLDLHMNYMDYVNDVCMYMFTAGQAQVMKDWVIANLSSLVSNVNNVYQIEICTDCVPPGCVDNDQDGYCLEDDCNDGDNTVPAASGTACDDGNPNTYNDLIQLDGCTCLGTVNACLENGGDADADGICNDFDCRPFDACYPKPMGTLCDDGYSQTSNDQIQSDGCTCLGITKIQATFLLEGFLSPTTQTMSTTLRNQQLLPLTSPYKQAPWNFAGASTLTSIPPNAVDWVLIMARDEEDTVLSMADGFVSKQGQLLGVDGSIGIDLAGGYSHYISIHHRNHLAVVANSPYVSPLNFTQSAATVKGIQQLKMVGGIHCLYAGDFNGSGIVNNRDYNQWIMNKSVLNQYVPIDADGNGIVNNLDYNLWSLNGAKIGYEGIQY